ncbi:hypothetical protein VA249_24970 [Vibrio alfacsensis]|uniref:glycosyltransferase family 2 protein n=1 Tax=Vibrio alfacsensis TaxID=1074311 RepID=UPI001BEEB9BC|nr:glycosyltransferase family 2 protein [Vibrio alfacsensis]BBM65851.1 hypothetical protein VA249_24970 [Vibrio alfacsensis]
MSRVAKRVDVLLSTYNGQDFISEQIESILTQTYKNVRLIIRDDGSNDRTVDIINAYEKKYDNVLFIGSGQNLGSTKSFFSLLTQSTSQYVMFCDQDDIWLPGKVLNCVEFIESKTDLETIPSLVYTDLLPVDSHLNEISDSFLVSGSHYFGSDFPCEQRLANNSVAGCTILMNDLARDLLLKVGFPSCKVVHDHWVAIVVSYFGRVLFLEKKDILYRQHDKNQVGSMDVDIAYFLKKILRIDYIVRHDLDLYFELRKKGIKLNILLVVYYKMITNIMRIIK